MILEQLNQDGVVYTKALIEQFGTSRETIRRDLTALEARGLLKKVYQGAVKKGIATTQLPFEKRRPVDLSAKKEIARKVCSLVREQMTIAMDSSTTNMIILEELKKHFRTLNILTNSFPVARCINEQDHFKLIFTGGQLVKEEECVRSNDIRLWLQNYHCDLYLMTCCGVSLAAGVTDVSDADLAVKFAMKDISNKTILICTHAYFEATALFSICKLDELDSIVTDSGTNRELVRKYVEHGITVL
jgi:DeoR/GlpR family transcriptional regulator of sugar metabolism